MELLAPLDVPAQFCTNDGITKRSIPVREGIQRTSVTLSMPGSSRDQAQEEQRWVQSAREARRKEVARAVKACIDDSERRRREEHGDAVPLEELIRRKQVCTDTVAGRIGREQPGSSFLLDTK